MGVDVAVGIAVVVEYEVNCTAEVAVTSGDAFPAEHPVSTKVIKSMQNSRILFINRIIPAPGNLPSFTGYAKLKE